MSENERGPGAPEERAAPAPNERAPAAQRSERRRGGPRQGGHREERRRPEDRGAPVALTPEEARKILGGDADLIVRCAEKISDHLVRNRVRRNQIRGVYTALARVRQRVLDSPAEQLRQLKLVIPRLHYMAGRKRETEPLKRALEALIRELPAAGSPSLGRALESTFDFAEAMVAYHAGAEQGGSA